jgi:hypothetical protein
MFIMTDSDRQRDEEGIDAILEAERIFLKNPSRQLVFDIMQAFEYQKNMTDADKKAALLNSSTLLRASTLVKQNAGTALMIIDKCLVLADVSVPGEAPVVLSVLSKSLAVAGSAHVASQVMSRTGSMSGVFDSQYDMAYRVGIEKSRNEIRQKILDDRDNRFKNTTLSKDIQAFETTINQYNAEAARLSIKASILEKIAEILLIPELNNESSNNNMEGRDYIDFVDFKAKYKNELNELDVLIKLEEFEDKENQLVLEPDFLAIRKSISSAISFQVLKQGLISLQKDINHNTKKADQLRNLQEIERTIEKIRTNLPKTDMKLSKETKADLASLKTLINRAVELDKHFKFNMTGDITGAVKTANDLENILNVIETNIHAYKSTDTESKKNIKVQHELVVLQKSLIEKEQALETFKKENKEKLELQQKNYDDVTSKLEPIIDKLIDETELKREIEHGTKRVLAKLSSAALNSVNTLNVFTDAMASTVISSDTIPTVDTEVVKKGENAAKAKSNKLTAEVLERAGNVLVTAARASATRNFSAQEMIGQMKVEQSKLIQAASGSSLEDVKKGTQAILDAAMKAAEKEGATGASVAVAATAAGVVLQTKKKQAASLSETADAVFQQSKTGLSVTELNKIEGILPDIKSGLKIGSMILTEAVQRLEKSDENDNIKFLDFIRLEEVCSVDPKFKKQSPTLYKRIIDFSAPSEKFQAIIDNVTSGHEIKKCILEILKGSSDVSSVASVLGETAYEKTGRIKNALSKATSGLNQVNETLENNLNALQVYFPPDNNPTKDRYILMADKSQVEFFKKILEIKKSIISVEKTLNESNETELKEISSDKGLTEDLAKLTAGFESLEKSIQDHSQQLLELDRQYGQYRKPFINVFGGVDNPVGQLDACVKRANFSDLIYLMKDVSPFVEFLKERKWHINGNKLVWDFCQTFLPENNSSDSDKSNFLKKMQTNQDGLNQLNSLFKEYLTYKLPTITRTFFKKIDDKPFTTDDDFLTYIKLNEHIYDSQRTLAFQKLAVMESMRKDYRSALSSVHQKLDIPIALSPEVPPLTAVQVAQLSSGPSKKTVPAPPPVKSVISPEKRNENAKMLYRHHEQVKRILEVENAFNENSTAQLITVIGKAFENDRKMTATEKSDAVVNSSVFLKGSKFVKENAGTALMVMGTSLVIVGAPVPGAAPIILATLATGLAVAGAAHVALEVMIRTSAMSRVFDDQNNLAYEKGLEKSREDLRKKRLTPIHNSYKNSEHSKVIAKFETGISQLEAEIERIKIKKRILVEISKIMNITELKGLKNTNKIGFNKIKIYQKDKFDELDKLLRLEESINRRLSLNSDKREYANIKDLEAINEDILKNTQTVFQLRSKQEINSDIDNIKKILTEPEFNFDPFGRDKDKKNEKLITLLNLLKDKMLKIDKSYDFTINPNMLNTQALTALFLTIDTSLKSDNKISAKDLDKEATALGKKLEEANSELKKYKNKYALVLNKEKENYEKNLKKAEVEVEQEIKSLKNELISEISEGTKRFAKKMVPNILSGLRSAEIATAAMERVAKSIDTIPTVDSESTIKFEETKKLSAEKASAEAVQRAADVVLKAGAEGTTINEVLTKMQFEQGALLQQADESSRKYVQTGTQAVIEAAQKAADTKGATLFSVKTAADNAKRILDRKIEELTSLYVTANNAFQQSKQRLTVTDINNLNNLLPDVKTGISTVSEVFTTAVKMLEKSAENDEVRFLDYMRLGEVCSHDPQFKVVAKNLQDMFSGVWEPNPKFQEIVNSFIAGHDIKKLMLEMMKGSNQVNTIKIDSEAGAIKNALTQIARDISDVNQTLEIHLRSLQTYFPPDDNIKKDRFVLMGNQDQVDFFNKVIKLKNQIGSISNTLNQSTPEQRVELKNDLDLRNDLKNLSKVVGQLDITIQEQSKRIEALDKEYEQFRKPYINIFGWTNDPANQLNECVNRADFSDLVFVLNDSVLKEFARYLNKSKPNDMDSNILKEFCEIYSFEQSMHPEDIKANRLAFLEKQKKEDLSKFTFTFQAFLTNNRLNLTPLSFKKIEDKPFNGESDFVAYIKVNEQLYDSQRVLAFQKLAVMESIRRDYGVALNGVNQQLDIPQVVQQAPLVAFHVPPPVRLHLSTPPVPEVLPKAVVLAPEVLDPVSPVSPVSKKAPPPPASPQNKTLLHLHDLKKGEKEEAAQQSLMDKSPSSPLVLSNTVPPATVVKTKIPPPPPRVSGAPKPPPNPLVLSRGNSDKPEAPKTPPKPPERSPRGPKTSG